MGDPRGASLMAWLVVDPAASFAAAPLNYLNSFGSKADSILNLTWGLLIISIVVVVVMTALVLWAVFRSRSSVVEEGEVAVPNRKPAAVSTYSDLASV